MATRARKKTVSKAAPAKGAAKKTATTTTKKAKAEKPKMRVVKPPAEEPEEEKVATKKPKKAAAAKKPAAKKTTKAAPKKAKTAKKEKAKEPEVLPPETEEEGELEETAVEVSEAESTEIRARIQTLKIAVDDAYFEMAGLLYDVYDRDIYALWGFESFKEYVEGELGFGARKAQYLIGIHDYFHHKLGDDSETVIEKVKPLGWTKVKELRAVVDGENVDEWVEKAQNMNAIDLAAAAWVYLQSDGEEEAETPSGETEVAKTMSFKLYPEQFDNVTEALERAGELTESNKKNHLLDTICTDWMATNAFTGEGKEAAVGDFLKKFEDQLGVRLFAVDPDKNEVIHGEDDNIKCIVVDIEEQEVIVGEELLQQLVGEDDEEEAEEEAEEETEEVEATE